MKDEKLENFYRAIGESKLVVAPMVEQSELAWRILSRKFGAELTFTPMFHAKIFNESLKYRQEHFRTHYSDSPLIVQFCANDPSNFVKAAQHIQEHSGVLAVDLNLGCPQHIARKGHYGSYLQDDWETIHNIVSKASKELTIPVTCKIRVFEDEKRTIEYAQMLEKAGCKMLTVHGRKREQKGHLTGLADWKQIMNVKNSVKIPVFANGNILYNEDIEKCIKQTNVDGVMSAEGNLYNPAIFQVKLYANWYLADEYLKICESFEGSATFSQAKAHLFKIFHASLSIHTDLRTRLGQVNGFDDINKIVRELTERIQMEFGTEIVYQNDNIEVIDGIKQLPSWVSQPFFRKTLPPNGSNAAQTEVKRENEVVGGEPLVVIVDSKVPAVITTNDAKRKSDGKKALKQQNKKIRQAKIICKSCPNVKSQKCTFNLCKNCCRTSKNDCRH